MIDLKTAKIGQRVRVRSGNQWLTGEIYGFRHEKRVFGSVDENVSSGSRDVVKIIIDHINIPPEVVAVTAFAENVEAV